MTLLGRRAFLGSALAAGGLTLAGCGAVGGGDATVRYWNLFGGGDGALMTELQATFNRQFPQIGLKGVTLLWGTPYYTKLSMAAAGGRAPEVAILHLARLPGFAPGRLLDPFDEKLLAEVGLNRSQFVPQMINNAVSNGRLYAIPLDTHPQVMYYNTDVIRKAGLLDDAGQLRPIVGEEALLDALTRVKQVTGGPAVSMSTADAGVVPWRLFWSLYRQLDGELTLQPGQRVGIDGDKALRTLTFMRRLTRDGLLTSGLDYPASVALFGGGKAGFLWNGPWEVQTFATGKLPFSIVRFPNIFGNGRTAGDSHALVLPHQLERDPERDRATYQFIAFLMRQSATWAQAGHVPAFQPVITSQAYQRLTPQSNYSDVAPDVQLDPPSWFSGSAAELQTQGAAAFHAVLDGILAPEQGLVQFTAAVDRLLDTPSPI